MCHKMKPAVPNRLTKVPNAPTTRNETGLPSPDSEYACDKRVTMNIPANVVTIIVAPPKISNKESKIKNIGAFSMKFPWRRIRINRSELPPSPKEIEVARRLLPTATIKNA